MSQLSVSWQIQAVIKRNSCTDQANADKCLHSTFNVVQISLNEYQMSVCGYLGGTDVRTCILTFNCWISKSLRAVHIAFFPIRRGPRARRDSVQLPKRPFPFPKAKLVSEPKQSALLSQFLNRTVTWLACIKKMVYYICVFRSLDKLRSTFRQQGTKDR